MTLTPLYSTTFILFDLKGISRFLLLVWLIFCFSLTSKAQTYSSVEDVPNPKELGTGYVTDPAGLLPQPEIDSLNYLLTELNRKTGVETAVVLVQDFREDEDAFQFATDLFRHWGIGKYKSDNGLLLFIASNRRQYRFVTGYGLEGLLPDATLKAIGERILVPSFQKEHYGEGVMNTIRTITSYLQQPENQKELNQLLAQYELKSTTNTTALFIFLGFVIAYGLAAWQVSTFKKPLASPSTPNRYLEVAGLVAFALVGFGILLLVIFFFAGTFNGLLLHFSEALPHLMYVLTSFALFFNHLSVLSNLRQRYKDDYNFLEAEQHFYQRVWWQSLIWPLTAVYLVIEKIRYQKSTSRFTPPLDTVGNPMNRLNRDDHSEAARHLSGGQLQEEKMNSQVYDIWEGSDGEVKVLPNPSDTYDRHLNCPACGFRTMSEPINIPIVKAMVQSQGKAKRVRLCRHCKHEEFIEQVVTPMRTKSDSSSSSSSSSASSSSSSSSSSSWGGGNTGGGGAGGSW